MVVLRSKIGVGNKVNIPKVIRDVCNIDVNNDLIWHIEFEEGNPCAFVSQKVKRKSNIVKHEKRNIYR